MNFFRLQWGYFHGLWPRALGWPKHLDIWIFHINFEVTWRKCEYKNWNLLIAYNLVIWALSYMYVKTKFDLYSYNRLNYILLSFYPFIYILFSSFINTRCLYCQYTYLNAAIFSCKTVANTSDINVYPLQSTNHRAFGWSITPYLQNLK